MAIKRPNGEGVQAPSPAGQSVCNLALVALCLGFFMITMDATVVNTALPDIGASIHTDVTGMTWILDGYTLVFACLLLSAGSVGDRLGARRVFLVGLAIFTLASLACALATTLEVLTAARIVQGVGAALALPTSLSLINASFPDRQLRARAIGVWGGLGGIAAGLGPVIGGVFTSAVSWQAIFLINVPIGIIASFLTRRHVVSPPPRVGSSFDLVGQLLAILAIGGLAFALIQGGAQGWTTTAVAVAFIMSIVSALGFLVVESRHRDPMLPLGVFRSREFCGAMFIGAAINVGFYGELFLLSVYFHHVRGYSSLIAGLALLPQAGIASIASLLGGKHTAKYGARTVMLIGLCVGALGLWAMLASSRHTPYALLVIPLLAIGFGTAYTMPAATATAMESAPTGRAGIASGALNTSRQLGSTFGVAVFGVVVGATTSFMTGYHISVLIAGTVFAAGAVTALLAVPPVQTSQGAAD